MGISSQSFTTTTTTTTLISNQPHSLPIPKLVPDFFVSSQSTHQQPFKMSIQSIILALFTFVAFVAAVPTNFNVFERADSCGANSTAHCCNDVTAQAVTNHDGRSHQEHVQTDGRLLWRHGAKWHRQLRLHSYQR